MRSSKALRGAGLLRAEGFDWVEGGGSFGGVDAKEEADCGGDEDYDGDEDRVHYEGEVDDHAYDVGNRKSKGNADDTTCKGEDCCLCQELSEN